MALSSFWLPAWVVGLVVLILPALLVALVYRWSIRLLIRLAGRYSAFFQTLFARSRGPVGVILVIIVLGLSLPAATLPADVKIIVARALGVAFVLAVGWTAARALDIGGEIYLRRFRTDVEDDVLARKHVTQLRILQRTAKTLLVVITIGSALMTLSSVRQYGVSLFASAGAAGLIVGLAARPVLSNLLAGIQIAMTQPIRVEDVVIVEGEWGRIETVTSTYVVIRIWDLRRMIVPLSYFIEKPFQNWTYQSADLIGSVFLHVDYTVPVDRLRQELDAIVKASGKWDRKVAVLQVTDAPAGMVELRALVSARNSGEAWDLRCEVREKLIAFLQKEYPDALPRQRVALDGVAAAVAGDASSHPRPTAELTMAREQG
jgi:small-conductance mechanosensitive channel